MEPYSLYLHIPFCVHRCAYCDFNTYAGLTTLTTDYARALCQEAAFLVRMAGERLPVHTIFFGGGTPSLMPLAEMETVWQALAQAFDLQPGLEATLEANPGTASLDTLRGLRRLGFNRLSLGMQSARVGELRLLERVHNVPDVIQAVSWARQAGFEQLNLDLIFGLPGQDMASWQATLEFTLALRPEHLSLYALTLEPGTPMHAWVGRGLLPEPDPDLAAEMYEFASARLEAAGFAQYEISNWAKRDASGAISACRHNLQYWRCQPYLGLGAGAHGYAKGLRIANVLRPESYIQRMAQGDATAAGLAFPRSPAIEEVQVINRTAEMGEVMMMGLRLVQEGVSARGFADRFGQSLEQTYGPVIRRLIEQGLLEWAGAQGDTLRLTVHGRLLGNRVFMEFI